MLNKAQIELYYELAQQINAGKHKPENVFKAFEEYPDEAGQIVNFWLQYNEMTQSVVHYLAIEKCRLLYEKCYGKEMSKWNLVKRNMRLIMNGLKQNLYGAKECLIGVGRTHKTTGKSQAYLNQKMK